MKTVARLLTAGAITLPSLAFATAGSAVTVNLSGGIVGAWTGTTLGIGFSFLPFLLVVAFAVEAFGKAPGEPRDFGAVIWRFVVVGVLLMFYGQVFGRLAALVSGVADSVAPQQTWEKLQAATEAFLKNRTDYQEQETRAAASGSFAGQVGQFLAGEADSLGGVLIDGVVSLILLCGQAAFRIVGTFGQVLSMLLYVLGPLAIAASLPRGSDAGTKWLRVFVSVLLWPLISALLVGLLTAFALEALKPASSYEAAYKSIALAGILTVTAFAVPVIASALTGAGMGAVGAGWSSMNAWSGAAAAGATTAAGVVGLGAARHGAQLSAAAQAAGGGGAGGGGGGAGGGLQSAGVVGGHGDGGGVARFALQSPTREAPAFEGGSRSPPWAAKGVGSIAPAQASVSPAADAAAGREVAAGGGVDFPRQAAQAPAQPPPFLWSGGGISPASADDSVPTLKPVLLPGPAAASPRAAGQPSPARSGAGGLVPAHPPGGGRPSAGGLPWANDEARRKPDARSPALAEQARRGGSPSASPGVDVGAKTRSPDEAKPQGRGLPPFPKR